MKHGASAYRNGTCRCEECREGNRTRAHQEMLARYAKRVDINGRLTAPLPPEKHGRRSTYTNWGCRCLECCAAKATPANQETA